MAIDLHTMLYLQGLGLLTPKRTKLLDIGPQNIYFAVAQEIRNFVAVQGQSVSDEVLEREIERLVYFSTPRPDERTTLLSEITDLTFMEYNSFDVCAGLKTEIFDLNYDLISDKNREYYDIVLNCGTTEHVFNQWNCFQIVHDATRVGGVFYHRLPGTGYIDHGYFTYTPIFFRDLASANDYEIIDSFFTFAGRNEPLRLGVDIRDHWALPTPNSGQLEGSDHLVPCFDVHVVMRKRSGGRFRCGLEIATAHSAVNSGMALRYAAESELHGLIKSLTAKADDALAQLDRVSREKEERIAERDAAITERDRLQQELRSTLLRRVARRIRRLRSSALAHN
jgi:hypothetical protein